MIDSDLTTLIVKDKNTGLPTAKQLVTGPSQPASRVERNSKSILEINRIGKNNSKEKERRSLIQKTQKKLSSLRRTKSNTTDFKDAKGR